MLLMAVAGLAHAVATLAVLPGVSDRLRANATAAAGASGSDIDGMVTVLRVGSITGAALTAVVSVLLLLLAFGVRRGRNAARIATWVVCGLGLLCGCGAALALPIQRGGNIDLPGTGLAAALTDAYPSGWIGLNTALSVAQALGYLVVALLLLLPGSFAFFRRPAAPASAAVVAPGWQSPIT
jgi:hypothetical protein